MHVLEEIRTTLKSTRLCARDLEFLTYVMSIIQNLRSLDDIKTAFGSSAPEKIEKDAVVTILKNFYESLSFLDISKLKEKKKIDEEDLRLKTNVTQVRTNLLS